MAATSLLHYFFPSFLFVLLFFRLLVLRETNSKSQWALPGPHCKLQISLGTAGPRHLSLREGAPKQKTDWCSNAVGPSINFNKELGGAPLANTCHATCTRSSSNKKRGPSPAASQRVQLADFTVSSRDNCLSDGSCAGSHRSKSGLKPCSKVMLSGLFFHWARAGARAPANLFLDIFACII